MQNEHIIAPYHTTDLTGRRTLVLAPHPDDETIGCGGSVLYHVMAGDPVKIVFLTNGAKGDTTGRSGKGTYVQLRQTEATHACRCLGVSDMEFWQYEDRGLADAEDALERLIDLLVRFRPELVYLPSPLEFHPDHRATAFLFKSALHHQPCACDAAFYEISQPLIVNTLVDITSVRDRKQKALQVYESQLAEKNYEDICMALNRFRSLTLSDTITHAEGFCVHPAGHIRKNSIFSMFYPDEKNLENSRQKNSTTEKKEFSGIKSLLGKLVFHRKNQ